MGLYRASPCCWDHLHANAQRTIDYARNMVHVLLRICGHNACPRCTFQLLAQRSYCVETSWVSICSYPIRQNWMTPKRSSELYICLVTNLPASIIVLKNLACSPSTPSSPLHTYLLVISSCIFRRGHSAGVVLSCTRIIIINPCGANFNGKIESAVLYVTRNFMF
jgi:hypothetical protein